MIVVAFFVNTTFNLLKADEIHLFTWCDIKAGKKSQKLKLTYSQGERVMPEVSKFSNKMKI